MRLWHLGAGCALVLGAGVGLAAGCSAKGSSGTGGAVNAGGAGGGIITTTTGFGGSGGFGTCAKFSDEAHQAPAALLIVLDRTASMGNSNKWGTAQIAIVQAVDKDVFDTMSLGMLTFPAPNSVPGPACIFNFPIYCSVSALPQVAVNPAGTLKSTDASGVRSQIYQYLVNNGPEGADSSDSSPIYAALNGAYNFIKTVPNVDKRMVILITDGGGSCTSIANPVRPAYLDNNGCLDWEQPPVMAQLISGAAADPTTPVNTFIVGVPGSDSDGDPVGGIDTPPYSMLLALSTYAVAGSPNTVDPTCDTNLPFSQGAPAPGHPCHIDLSNAANFNPDALATAIASLRGKALGCVYDLPAAPPGETIDPALVNVVATIDGNQVVIPKRSNAADTCSSEPCWDYNGQGKVELIGIACTSLGSATTAKVEIFVGCATILNEVAVDAPVVAVNDGEVLTATALEQAHWVRTRQLSAEELTRLYLARIAAHDARCTAFVSVLARTALWQARHKDRSRKREGAFFGVPIGIKDLNFVRGAFTRFGSRAMRYLWSPVDDRVTARIRGGGFVILGKLATSELGALPVTEPPIHAPTRNPWDVTRTPGGSSGGSAAAVAAGLLPIAQGSDGAGSIRIPSAFCHLFGFKPSRGVVPDAYGRDDARNLSVSGPIAQSVDDAAALLDVMAGPARRPYAELAREPPRRLRVRVVHTSPLCEPEPEVRATVARIARALETLGHEVEEGAPPSGTLEEFLPLWQWIVGSVPVLSKRLLGPVPRWLAEASRSLTRAAVHARHDELAQRLLTWFGDADLCLSPTVGRAPPRIGELERDDPAATFAAAATLGAFTAVFNITGQPAASIPAGLGASGHPIGVQLAGRAQADGQVLAVARQLESVMPWRQRRAPGFWPERAP